MPRSRRRIEPTTPTRVTSIIIIIIIIIVLKMRVKPHGLLLRGIDLVVLVQLRGRALDGHLVLGAGLRRGRGGRALGIAERGLARRRPQGLGEAHLLRPSGQRIGQRIEDLLPPLHRHQFVPGRGARAALVVHDPGVPLGRQSAHARRPLARPRKVLQVVLVLLVRRLLRHEGDARHEGKLAHAAAGAHAAAARSMESSRRLILAQQVNVLAVLVASDVSRESPLHLVEAHL
mmetsp:Transcript_29380/g.87200  ORF Transcript_29380/g.87200 Transcript_29380/m.87200 type:complete len:232 (+) Transcript_29380:996-1691(+)